MGLVVRLCTGSLAWVVAKPGKERPKNRLGSTRFFFLLLFLTENNKIDFVLEQMSEYFLKKLFYVVFPF